MNTFSFTGRLGHDAEIKLTKAGSKYATFSVSNTLGYGEHEKTLWFRCTLPSALTKGALPEYLLKGTFVFISGRLDLRSYQDNSGRDRVSAEVFINQIQMLKTGSRTSGTANNEADRRSGGIPPPDFGDFDEDIPF